MEIPIQISNLFSCAHCSLKHQLQPLNLVFNTPASLLQCADVKPEELSTLDLKILRVRTELPSYLITSSDQISLNKINLNNPTIDPHSKINRILCILVQLL